MDNTKYYTVKEFAELSGTTQQAVYKRLNGTLKDYVVIANEKKYIKATALNEHSTPKPKPEQGVSTEYNQPFNNPTTTLNNAVEQPYNNALNYIIETLKEQITEKDKQLSEKDKQIELLQNTINDYIKQSEQKDLFIQEQTAKITSLLEQSQQITNQFQLLQLADKADKPKAKNLIQRLFSKRQDDTEN